MSEQQNEPVMAAADVEAVKLSPEQEETSPKADVPKVEAPSMAVPKVEPSKVEPSGMEMPKAEAGKREEPRFPGKMMIMAPGDRNWDYDAGAAKPASDSTAKPSGAPRVAAMAAIIALATVAGAVGGALATAGLGHFNRNEVAVAKDTTAKDAVDASIARIDSEIASLKSSIDQTARADSAQLGKTNDRLEKVEKAQAEPMAKLAKLSEAVDKLRAAPQTTAAASSAAAREVTGTIAPPATAAAAPKTEVGRLPVVQGWALRDVGNGGALIEGRGGVYEVYAGDPLPGLGRVDAIRRQDGRWVVVTSKGLIVSR